MKEKKRKLYSRFDQIPRGESDPDRIEEGCLVLEGGAWREVYTQGALDALLEADINFQAVAGVSAGALSGIGYLSGHIGWAARVNLTYCRDPEYCGLGAVRRDHGVTGFSYIFGEVQERYPLDIERFRDPGRRFAVSAADVETGEAVWFEKGKTADIMRAVQASATVPYVSRPVEIEGRHYLDGGCSGDFIPYRWAQENGYRKIAVIRTRDRAFRDTPEEPPALKVVNHIWYKKYPELMKKLLLSHASYNAECDGLDAEEKAGRVFVFAPEEPVTLRRFERDPEKLGDLYFRGYEETKSRIPALREYLASRSFCGTLRE